MSRGRAGAWLRWGLFALAAVLIAWAVMRQWAGVADSLATVGWSRVALATGLALVALAFNTLSWRTVMMSVGLQAPLREASGVFLVSQAGKYVPGAVWPVVAQAEFARAHGVTRARATVGSLVAMAVGVVMAAVVGAVALAVFSPGSVLRYWWVLVIAAALAVTLVPPVLTRLLALALRVLRREGEPPRIGGKALAASAGWSALNWAALGAQAWVLLRALGGSDATYGLATGAFALAWLVGFLVVFAPAGLGPREYALALFLGSVVTGPQALALALLSRFAMTLADAIGLGLGAFARRSRRAARDRTSAP
jgi:glycosyltransferase 2 family protein